jgi:hypothetical protein
MSQTLEVGLNSRRGFLPNTSYGEPENFVLLILLFSTSIPEPVYLVVSQLKTWPDLKLDPRLQRQDFEEDEFCEPPNPL